MTGEPNTPPSLDPEHDAFIEDLAASEAEADKQADGLAHLLGEDAKPGTLPPARDAEPPKETPQPPVVPAPIPHDTWNDIDQVDVSLFPPEYQGAIQRVKNLSASRRDAYGAAIKMQEEKAAALANLLDTLSKEDAEPIEAFKTAQAQLEAKAAEAERRAQEREAQANAWWQETLKTGLRAFRVEHPEYEAAPPQVKERFVKDLQGFFQQTQGDVVDRLGETWSYTKYKAGYAPQQSRGAGTPAPEAPVRGTARRGVQAPSAARNSPSSVPPSYKGLDDPELDAELERLASEHIR